MAATDLHGVSHRTLVTATLRFHVAEAGPVDAPVILFLHGFPEFWYSWRHQLLGLCGQFRVVAPDLRGYGGTDKPGRGHDLSTLAGDIAALVAALGQERGQPDLAVTLVGHDWGGVIAWATAALHPQCVRRLAILNAPHPRAMLTIFLRHPRQLQRSWYIGLFQLPGLFEWQFRRAPHRTMARMLQAAAGRKGVFPESEVQIYADALMAPGTLESALGYYRAVRGFVRTAGLARQPVAMPVLTLWGRRDPALGAELVEAARRFAAGPYDVQWFDGAGHWLQQEAPEAVNAALHVFAAADPSVVNA